MTYPREYGNYTLLESIGKGGMSAIDLAQTTVADAQYVRFLVIKRVQTELADNQSYIRMFQDEARITGELQHANIAQVYDFGQQGNEFFLAMEYIPGIDLRELQRTLAIQRRGIPVRISMRILAEVLDALEYAHGRIDVQGRPLNIVHRDVNPRNMMLSVRGEVKLIDFGVAKAENKLDKTVGHTLKGKFAYMAPEQFEGTSIDSRADLFALGLVLHELADGIRPFKGLTEFQIMHRILSASIPALVGPRDHPNPELIHQIHQTALAKDPNDRYQSAAQMKRAIENAMDCCGGLASNQELAQFLQEVAPQKVKQIAGRLESYTREVTTKIEDPTLILARHAKIPPTIPDQDSTSLQQVPADKTAVTVTTPSRNVPDFTGPDSLPETDVTHSSKSWSGQDPVPSESNTQTMALQPNNLSASAHNLSATTEVSKTQPTATRLPTTSAPINPAVYIKEGDRLVKRWIVFSVLVGLLIGASLTWFQQAQLHKPTAQNFSAATTNKPQSSAEATLNQGSLSKTKQAPAAVASIKKPIKANPPKNPVSTKSINTSARSSSKTPKPNPSSKNIPRPTQTATAETQNPTTANTPRRTTPEQSTETAPKVAQTPSPNTAMTPTPATTASPPREAPKDAAKQTYVKVYLMAGTVGGKQGLPVYLNTITGKPIAKTASLKELSLPVGKHRLIIVNPQNDEISQKTLNVPSGGGSIIVTFNDP